MSRDEALQRRMAEVLSELAVVPLVHIVGGPCVESAPLHEEFLEVDFGPNKRGVTCPHCLIYLDLMLPDDNGVMPTFTSAVAKLRNLCGPPSQFAVQYRTLRRAYEKAKRKAEKDKL